jgi:glycosyltransferase involved in cell wall biosynthesis
MKLSIITINRNNAAGLLQTIGSVMSQTFTGFEYIVVDGTAPKDAPEGGTCEDRDILNRYVESREPEVNGFTPCVWKSSHGRIGGGYYTEPDSGIYNALNKGLLKASGEYVLFLNSGDWLYHTDVLLSVFNQQRSEDILFGTAMVHIQNAQPFEHGPRSTDISPFQLLLYSMPHSSSFIKRKLFSDYGLYDETYKIVADMKFFYDVIFNHSATLFFVGIAISHFDGNGISSTATELCIQERERVLQEFLPKAMLTDFREYQQLLNERDFVRYNDNKKAIDIYSFMKKYWLTKKIQTLLYLMIHSKSKR